jgi:hypothetical protein
MKLDVSVVDHAPFAILEDRVESGHEGPNPPAKALSDRRGTMPVS